ncbi:MAG TPA: hypothetical protein VMM92_04940 [Thermoanaerobaculia bacterium]|nr:hypothetical protein [Thermoanaerobaculia bacterium]
MKRQICCVLLALGTVSLPLWAASAENKVVGAPPAGAAATAAPDPTADFAKRDQAESILKDLRQSAGKDFSPSYQSATLEKLLGLSADTLAKLASGDKSLVEKILGSTTNDMTYTPLTPCRIFDSRSGSGVQGAGTGPLAAGTPVSIDVAGGAASSCGVPFPTAKAAVLNFTIVTPAGPGDLRAWPWDSSNLAPPNAAVINYTNLPGLAIANGIVVPICNITTATGGTCNKDLFLRTDVSGAHLVIDVLGYFGAPAATALSCETLSSPFSAAVGTQFNIGSPICDAGYTLTGGGIELGQAWTSGDELLGSNPFGGNQWQCLGYNGGGNAWSGNCWAICCRVPGR